MLTALIWQFVAVILQRLSKEGRCNFLFCIIMSKLHLAFKKMADDLELRSQVVRISCEELHYFIVHKKSVPYWGATQRMQLKSLTCRSLILQSELMLVRKKK